MDRATQGEKIFLGSGVVLFLMSFFGPWAKFDFGGLELGGLGGSASFKAWDYNFIPLKLGLIIGLIGIIAAAVRIFVETVDVPPVAHAITGGATLLLILLTVLTGPPGSGIDLGGAGVERGLMLFLAIIPAAGMAYGGYMHMQESGGTTPSFGGGPTTPPPPPA